LNQEPTRELAEEATAEITDPNQRRGPMRFEAPTAKCQLDEALKSNKAIFREQFRE